MPLFTLTGADTLIINNRVIRNMANNDISVLTYSANIADKSTGRSGNTIISKNESGNNGDLTLRLMRGSGDDIFLQSLLTQQNDVNFSTFVLLTGQLVKNLGDGLGNSLQDVYALTGGFFSKQVDVTTNVQGSTEQGVAVYHIGWSRVARTQQ